MPPTDREKNRFSARARRYARVGTNVGGVAARMAGARFSACRSIAPPTRRAGRGARRPEGPDHEGGAAARHHPRSAAAGIHHRADQAAEPGAADGLGLRQAPHAGRARRRLAEQIRKLRASSGGGRFARPGAPRARRTTARNWPASCSTPTCSRRSKPISASCAAVRHPPALRSGDRHQRDDQGNRARGCARNSTIAARPSTSRSTATCSRTTDSIRVPQVWPELSTGRLLTLDWLEGSRLLDAQGRHARRAQSARERDVHRLVVAVQPLRRDPRRSASRQLFGVHDEGQARRHQSPRLRLHPHLPAEIRRRRRRSLQRVARGDDALVVHAYETWGFQRSRAT